MSSPDKTTVSYVVFSKHIVCYSYFCKSCGSVTLNLEIWFRPDSPRTMQELEINSTHERATIAAASYLYRSRRDAFLPERSS